MEDDSSEFMNMELAAALLGRSKEEYQINSTLSKRNTEWWEKNLYCIRNGPIFFPTNLPRVSYLDLEQHTQVFPNLMENQIAFYLWPYDERAKEAKQHPLIEPGFRNHVKHEENSKYMESAHYHLVKYVIDLEYHTRTYENLKENFDAARFRRLVDYCLGQRFLGPEIQSKCEMIVDLLSKHCGHDSALVVQVFTDICKRFRMADLVFLYMLPTDMIQFFGKHLKQVGGDVVDVFTEWFRDEDLMIHAIYEGAPEKVKKLVHWEFPSTLLPFAMTPSVACMVRGTWPRQKDGVELQSYNSLEYFSMFTTFLAACVALALERFFGVETLWAGFQTFWRSVPTPHLPFSDMAACLHQAVTTYPDRLPFEAAEVETILEGLQELLAEQDEYCYDVYAPRSLQHLCRYTVRRMCPTPEGIAALPVADRLKPYLCLDE